LTFYHILVAERTFRLI